MAVIPNSDAAHTGFRVIATALPILLAMGLTAAVLLLIPAVREPLIQVLKEDGVTFTLVVIVPAVLLALVTTFFAARILWSASDTQPK